MGLFSNRKEKKAQKEREAIEYMLKRAEEGDKASQRLIGLYCAEWYPAQYDTVPKDNRKAFEYLLRAAQKTSCEHDGWYGDDEAAYYVGECYTKGLGTEKNYSEAVSIFMALLANSRNNYFAHKSDCISCLELIRNDTACSYNPDDVDSAYRYGVSLCIGSLPNDNRNECMSFGMELLRDAAARGHADSMNLLSALSADDEDAAYKYLISAAQNGQVHAQCKLGSRYYKQNILDESLFWYEKAAAQGDERGERFSGIIYYKRYDVQNAEEMLCNAITWRPDINFAPSSTSYLLLGRIYQEKDHKTHDDNLIALGFYKQGMEIEQGLSGELIQALGENSCTYSYNLLLRTIGSQPYRNLYGLD